MGDDVCDLCRRKRDGVMHPVAGVPGMTKICSPCQERSSAAHETFKTIALARADEQHRDWLLKARAAVRNAS